MKKAWGIACTIGFAMFWICGGLAALAVAAKQPVDVPLLVLALLGGAVGVLSRFMVARQTRDVKTGLQVPPEKRASL